MSYDMGDILHEMSPRNVVDLFVSFVKIGALSAIFYLKGKMKFTASVFRVVNSDDEYAQGCRENLKFNTTVTFSRMKITDFLDMTPYCLVDRCQRFRRTYSIFKIKGGDSTKLS
jgi:hypothetical protein